MELGWKGGGGEGNFWGCTELPITLFWWSTNLGGLKPGTIVKTWLLLSLGEHLNTDNSSPKPHHIPPDLGEWRVREETRQKHFFLPKVARWCGSGTQMKSKALHSISYYKVLESNHCGKCKCFDKKSL